MSTVQCNKSPQVTSQLNKSQLKEFAEKHKVTLRFSQANLVWSVGGAA